MEEKKYNITNHAYERYAERMANKEQKTDMRIYIANHKDDINDRIHKLIHFGELIYEGKVGDHAKSHVYYKDRWIIIVDENKNNVVTLYKVDLLDDEVSDLFANKVLIQIKQQQTNLYIEKVKVQQRINSFEQKIEENKTEIAYLKKLIKQYEEKNEAYTKMINTENIEVTKLEKNINQLVETLIRGRKL